MPFTVSRVHMDDFDGDMEDRSEATPL